MANEISIKSVEHTDRLNALKNSRLKVLLKDPQIFEKMCEAAALLLNSDKIRACDESSIFGALYKAVTLGCRLEPEFGECHLIPRSLNVGTREKAVWLSVCCFQLGYKFWKAKALESGHIKYMATREVFAEDTFSFKHGSGGTVWEHISAEQNSGKTTWFYAVAPLKDGGEIFECINKQAAEKYRGFSESQLETVGTGTSKIKRLRERPVDIWLKNYAAMALRLPVKRLCAMLPLTKALETAMNEDGAVTYLQADGQMHRLAPGEVEEAAEQNEVKELPEKLTAEQGSAFEGWEDALAASSTFEEVAKYYEQFKADELYKNKEFVRLFFTNIARTATHEEQLGKVFHASKEWQKETELVKILTNRKEEIEKSKTPSKTTATQ